MKIIIKLKDIEDLQAKQPELEHLLEGCLLELRNSGNRFGQGLCFTTKIIS